MRERFAAARAADAVELEQAQFRLALMPWSTTTVDYRVISRRREGPAPRPAASRD